MAYTVSSAFDHFLSGEVNIPSNISETARSSRDNLLDNIKDFDNDQDFFSLYREKDLAFGSFAKHTKITPLDDIDLMICLKAEGRTYSYNNGLYKINGNNSDKTCNLVHANGYQLNSAKVINRFIKKLSNLHDYEKAELHRNQEAATLKLKSRAWNFDIVPCFYMDIDHYLIPDGKGNWKITDPRIDKERITRLNIKTGGNLLKIIRLMKYLIKHDNLEDMNSYLLETMLCDYYEGNSYHSNWNIADEIKNITSYLSYAIYKPVIDPKNMQGNLNSLDNDTKSTISKMLSIDNKLAQDAIEEERKGNIKNALEYWKIIFGPSFPQYSA